MAPDSMRVRLHLRLIRVLAVPVDTASRLEVEVMSTRSWSRRPHCGFKTRTVDGRRRKNIRDLPVSGRRVTLAWIRRRFACGNRDERHLETHAEFEGPPVFFDAYLRLSLTICTTTFARSSGLTRCRSRRGGP